MQEWWIELEHPLLPSGWGSHRKWEVSELEPLGWELGMPGGSGQALLLLFSRPCQC